MICSPAANGAGTGSDQERQDQREDHGHGKEDAEGLYEALAVTEHGPTLGGNGVGVRRLAQRAFTLPLMNHLQVGARLLGRGVRRQSPPLAFAGAALVALAALKAIRGPDRQLLYSKNLKAGERLQVGVIDPDSA